MLYDDGNHAPPQRNAPAPPYMRPNPVQGPFPMQAPMQQGSYADYYNGMGGGMQQQTPVFRRNIAHLPYNLQNALLLRSGQDVPEMRMAPGVMPQLPPTPMQRPRFRSVGRRLGTPGGMSYMSGQGLGGQFDINGRPRGAWDYQEPQPARQYPMVTY